MPYNPRCIKTIDGLHADVHDYDIWLVPFDCLDGRKSIFCKSNYLQVCLVFYGSTEGLSIKPILVCDNNADGFSFHDVKCWGFVHQDNFATENLGHQWGIDLIQKVVGESAELGGTLVRVRDL